MCDDQENKARACPGYVRGQTAGQGLSQRPDRCPVAGHRTIPARTSARRAGPAPHLAAAPDHRGDPVRRPGRGRLAVPARRLPPLAPRVRILRGLAPCPHAGPAAPRAARPGPGGGRENARTVNGRKRPIAVDALGLVRAVVITAASVQDRDAARPLLWNMHRAHRRVRLAWADAVYAGGRLTSWAAALKITIEVIAKRQQHAFEVLPRRWVVERTFAWISKHRRTVRDYETLPASHEAMILWAMTVLMARRLAQPAHLSNAH